VARPAELFPKLFPTAAPYLPQRLSLPTLRQAVQDCRGCDLYRHATQAVFGEGRRRALIMFVGEQPGDQEDLKGKPFVGPAGRMLDKALVEAGIDRREVFLTNAVKHFKFTTSMGVRGKRRLHSKPTARQVNACRPWLAAELEVVKPQMLVALGATAAQTLFGPKFSVTRERGRAIERQDLAPWCMATVHPSSLLRAPDERSRRQAWRDFVRDLTMAANEFQRRTAQRAAGP
jgi:uracil-DNA glycosylase